VCAAACGRHLGVAHDRQWGIRSPTIPARLYVGIDALTNYLTGAGGPGRRGDRQRQRRLWPLAHL